jgi:hypothetical protein
MSSLMEMLGGVLGGDGLSKIGDQLGADRKTTQSAVATAMPMLLGALSRNASKGDGAQSLLKALSKDHDGSVLENPSAVLSDPQSGPGEGILKHVFGARRQAVETGIGKTSGLDSGSAAKLLTMLAPLVMGALGKARRKDNLDAGALGNLLGQESRQLTRDQPQAMGLLGSLLDADGDGDVDLGDMAKQGMKALGKFFK